MAAALLEPRPRQHGRLAPLRPVRRHVRRQRELLRHERLGPGAVPGEEHRRAQGHARRARPRVREERQHGHGRAPQLPRLRRRALGAAPRPGTGRLLPARRLRLVGGRADIGVRAPRDSVSTMVLTHRSAMRCSRRACNGRSTRSAAASSSSTSSSGATRPRDCASSSRSTTTCSGRSSCATRPASSPCDIPLIISNHADLKPVADAFGVRFEVFKVTKATKREVEDAEIRLAGGARDRPRGPRAVHADAPTSSARPTGAGVINIHHSFLPAFIGSKPTTARTSAAIKLIGATAHYATANLDEGPIIEQGTERVLAPRHGRRPAGGRAAASSGRSSSPRCARTSTTGSSLRGNKTVVFTRRLSARAVRHPRIPA